MTEPTWREIRELTRLRRRQAATVYHSVSHHARERIAVYVTPDYTPGLIGSAGVMLLWDFQCGRCYMCDREFRSYLRATKEHVRPKAKGGKTAGNVLLACVPCNNAKADRDPTKRELRLLALYNTDARLDFHILLMTNTPPPEVIAAKSKRRILKERGKKYRKFLQKIYDDLTPPPPVKDKQGAMTDEQRSRARRANERAQQAIDRARGGK